MSRILYKKEVSSTNSLLSEYIKNEVSVEEFSVFYADFQTKGRGRASHVWESEAEKNLLMSVLLYPNVPPSEQFLVTEWVSLALVEALKNNGLENVFIKWPNDIYVGNKKIAGILIEHVINSNSILYSIAGIGLNMNQEKFSPQTPNPTSIILETNIFYDIFTILKQIIEKIKTLKERSPESIHEEYLKHLYLKDQLSKFLIVADNQTVEGKIINVDRLGVLHLDIPPKEIREFSFNEVKYIL